MKQPSYLYGSIHIQDARVFAFDSTVVLGTLQSCDAFAMEILMDEIDPMELKKSQFMPKGKLLSKMMKPADFAKLDSVCKAKLGITAYFVNGYKPFFLSSALQQADMAKDKEDALDLYFLKKARAAGKNCYGVEQYQDQIAAIDAISLKEQIKMLVESLEMTEQDSVQSEFEELLNAYLTYNFDKMLELSNDPSMPKKFNKVFQDFSNKFPIEEYAYMRIEYNLVMAIKSLVKPHKSDVAFIDGHGELNMYNTAWFGSQLGATMKYFYNVTRDSINGKINCLRKISIADSTEQTVKDNGNKYDLLVIAQPTQPFSDKDKYAIDLQLAVAPQQRHVRQQDCLCRHPQLPPFHIEGEDGKC